MRIATFLFVLLLSCGSNPRFHVGECIQYQAEPPRETWENQFDINKIIEVYSHSYRVIGWSQKEKRWFPYVYPIDASPNYIKVSCPN